VTTVAEIQSVLERLAPSSKAAGWDPVGLQIGDSAAAVSRIGVCHEVTAAIVERVLDDEIDLLVSYHPLLFRPTLRLVAGPGAAGRALALAGAGVSLLVAHTAFDVAEGGTADALADALGLVDPTPFEPLWGSESAHPDQEPLFGVYERQGESGFLGRVGTFAGSLDELVGTVQAVLKGSARVSGGLHGDTLRVAVVPGSGASAIPGAAGAGANVLVTGDVKHHDARAAGELGVAVIDPGHAATESPGVARLYAAVAGETETAIDLTDIDADPWAGEWKI